MGFILGSSVGLLLASLCLSRIDFLPENWDFIFLSGALGSVEKKLYVSVWEIKVFCNQLICISCLRSLLLSGSLFKKKMNIQIESRSNTSVSNSCLFFSCFHLVKEFMVFSMGVLLKYGNNSIFLYLICLNAHDLDTWALVTVAA